MAQEGHMTQSDRQSLDHAIEAFFLKGDVVVRNECLSLCNNKVFNIDRDLL